jgi:hypothetical protein
VAVKSLPQEQNMREGLGFWVLGRYSKETTMKDRKMREKEKGG